MSEVVFVLLATVLVTSGVVGAALLMARKEAREARLANERLPKAGNLAVPILPKAS